MHKNKLKIKFSILIFFIVIFTFSVNYATNTYEQFIQEIDEIEFMENGNLITSFKDESPIISTYGVNNIFLFKNLKATKLPEKYCLQDEIKINIYKQVGETCWIYSTNSILETTMAKENKTTVSYDKFDVNATENDSAKIYNRIVNEGGNPKLALSFYTCGYGPKTTKTNEINTKIGDYVLLSAIIKGKDSKGNIQYNGGAYTEEQVKLIRNNIKQHIIQYGAVTSCMYSKEKEYFSDETNYLNSEAYFCDYNYIFGQTNTINPDHQITIIGWDDNYSKENFNSKHRPKNDGAYIVLNSWGEEFSKDGIFYISYEDTFVENSVYGVCNVKEKDYYNLYQHDELGLNYILAYSSDKKINYGANVFTRNTNEEELLTEVSVANLVDSSYEIYVNKTDGDLDFNKFEKVAETGVLKPGYHAIKIKKDVVLSGKKFVIAVKYKSETDGYNALGIEYTNKKECKELGGKSEWEYATINKGESFIYSEKEKYWGDLYEIFSSVGVDEKGRQMKNLCIKGFTQKYEDTEPPTIKNITITPNEWTNKKVTVTINEAKDDKCSVNDLQYSFDGGISWQKSNSKEYLENTKDIEVWIKDLSNNIYKHIEQINVTKIDKQNPTIDLLTKNENNSWTIIVSDNESGIKSFIVNSKEISGTEYVFEKVGTYKVIVTDNAGNSITRNFKGVSESFLLESEDYIITNDYISQIEQKTTKEKFLNKINSNAKKIVIYDGEKEISNLDLMKTGMKIILQTDEEKFEYTIVVTGDSNGDGKVNAKDLINAVKQYKYDKTDGKKGEKLKDEYLYAIKFSDRITYTAYDLIMQIREYKKCK